MGAAGPNRRLDRAPAGRVGGRHPLVQARPRAGAGRPATPTARTPSAASSTSRTCAPRTTPSWPPRSRRRPRRRTSRGGARGGVRVRRPTRPTRTTTATSRASAVAVVAADAAGASARAPLEGTFDHGDEGYGLWLDPAVQDDPVYAEHWAGHRPVTVVVEPERIVITRSGDDTGPQRELEPVAHRPGGSLGWPGAQRAFLRPGDVSRRGRRRSRTPRAHTG